MPRRQLKTLSFVMLRRAVAERTTRREAQGTAIKVIRHGSESPGALHGERSALNQPRLAVFWAHGVPVYVPMTV